MCGFVNRCLNEIVSTFIPKRSTFLRVFFFITSLHFHYANIQFSLRFYEKKKIVVVLFLSHSFLCALLVVDAFFSMYITIIITVNSYMGVNQMEVLVI